jgi:hypothetical protein
VGATLDLFLEYDDSDQAPFSGVIDGVIDFTKSRNIVYCKPYSVTQAIAGVRGDSKIKPKIGPRGFPKHMNDQIEKYLEDYYGLDYQYAGWLFYHEVIDCLDGAGIKRKDLPASISLVLEIFENLTNKFGEDRVRLIFAIESA